MRLEIEHCIMIRCNLCCRSFSTVFLFHSFHVDGYVAHEGLDCFYLNLSAN